MIPLAFIENGEKAVIVDFIKKSKDFFCHLRDIGLFTGKVVEVMNNKGNGPILLRIDESRVAIGRGMAMKIMVRRLQ